MCVSDNDWCVNRVFVCSVTMTGVSVRCLCVLVTMAGVSVRCFCVSVTMAAVSIRRLCVSVIMAAVSIMCLCVSVTMAGVSKGCLCFSVKVWDNDWCVKMVFVGHSQSVSSLAIYPHGPLFISASRDCTIRVWSMETCDEVDK